MSFVNTNIKKAKTIPSEFYYSARKFEEIKQHLFPKYWQFVCDQNQLNKHGDAFPYDFIENFIEEPLVLVNNHGTINSMSNVCTHRGNILVEEPTNLNGGIICRYHGRKFDTCGKFKFMPKCEDVENFPSESDNLPQIEIDLWKNMIFIINDKIILLFQLNNFSKPLMPIPQTIQGLVVRFALKSLNLLLT